MTPGDTWSPGASYLYQDLQLRVTVAAQLVLVVSEADSCLSFIQQPLGSLSQVAKLLHPAVSRQRALPKWYLPRYFPKKMAPKKKMRTGKCRGGHED